MARVYSVVALPLRLGAHGTKRFVEIRHLGRCPCYNNAYCTADEAYAESAKCIEQPAAKLALYDDTLRRIYHLEPQGQAMGHLGEVVTVQGALRDDVIHVASLQVVTEIGLPIGRQAPAFFARDQFGHEQTLDTLRGSKGTVLLFVRSADW